jgi:hypothetical protein
VEEQHHFLSKLRKFSTYQNLTNHSKVTDLALSKCCEKKAQEINRPTKKEKKHFLAIKVVRRSLVRTETNKNTAL